ncbi:transposase-like protein, IS1515 [Streptococcus pneumoniae]|nr:transposase-like protein, IS1515 [Streptococcus pneumoniae]
MDGKQCLIYSYYNVKASRNVEVLKGRSGTKKGLDYWEPYAPQKQYEMERLPKNKYIGSSSTDRWDGIEKNVVFCDCKEYVSAFDLFFYHYNFKKISTQRGKQDFIRLRSKPVADILKNNTSSYTRYKKEMVIDNVKVDDKVCEIISEIMDESYTDIQILTHKLYSKGDDIKASKTIWMKKSGKEYSEAFAGTGEARIILLVNDIVDLFGNCKKCYTIFMETVYDKAQKLNSKNFKLLIGVKKETFQLMLEHLNSAYQIQHRKGGRPRSLPMEDQLIMTLRYLRYYPTQRLLAFDFGVGVATVNAIITWVEDTLRASGSFDLDHLEAPSAAVAIDVTESPIQRPKKTKAKIILVKRNDTP